MWYIYLYIFRYLNTCEKLTGYQNVSIALDTTNKTEICVIITIISHINAAKQQQKCYISCIQEQKQQQHFTNNCTSSLLAYNLDVAEKKNWSTLSIPYDNNCLRSLHCFFFFFFIIFFSFFCQLLCLCARILF